MAHDLDGDWNLFIVTDIQGVIKVTPEGTFHLRHDGSNRLDNTSNHGGRELTGSSMPDGPRFQIRFAEKIPAGAGRFKFLPYDGNLIERKPVSGPPVRVVIGGFLRPLEDTQPPPLPAKGEVESELLAGQVDGIWIATQP